MLRVVVATLGMLAASQAAAAPTVTISNGVVVGQSNVLQGQDRFLGIPFALPPTGDRRLRAPQPLTSGFGTLTATTSPSGCPQLGGSTTTPVSTVTAAGTIATASTNVFNVLGAQPTNPANPEDCLYLNVQRPSGTNSTSKLPVLVWIFGGGFETGSTSLYDGQLMLAKAMSLKKPYIFVAMNYRVAAFGFLASAELATEGNTNLGLRDQRAALEWVQDNIGPFGGDPSKVTIWGESAGSWSVMDQTIINRGDNTYRGKPLFRGAMMDSGSTFPALEVSHPKPQGIFDDLARYAGCTPGSADVLSCLRKVDYNTFLSAQNNQTLPNSAISLAYIARPDPSNAFFPLSPEEAVARGQFAKVPIITGIQQDEGAFFASMINGFDGNNDTDLIRLFSPIFPEASTSALLALGNTYPKDVTAGCPYYTGIFNEIYPGYKRLAAIVGDAVFVLSRRLYLTSVSPSVRAWSFVGTYYYGTPVLGTCHVTDILALYFGIGSSIAIDEIFTRYISFINYADPNVIGVAASKSYVQWPQYENTNRRLMSFDTFGVSILNDTFRQTSYLSLAANDSVFRM
ncbi:hypothetical protein AMS68_003836 [Peltaster fructicola]|uniref:Carboxylic ester hydrolase n=1 Tax=Peltaster fructicola TaxID=286661 RepID=A0A6H0XUL7_9PEZI|nr:hypothetical protein AMS68_003836 [Peltaster fructicola]